MDIPGLVEAHWETWELIAIETDHECVSFRMAQTSVAGLSRSVPNSSGDPGH